MAIGLTNGRAFTLPLTQIELGDSLGLSPVHVNRILQEFRKHGLIVLERHRLNIVDLSGLQVIAEFNDAYLNFESASAELTDYFDRLENVKQS